MAVKSQEKLMEAKNIKIDRPDGISYELSEEEALIEFALCQSNFLYFLWPQKYGCTVENAHYVFLRDATTMKVIPLEPWPEIVKFARLMETGVNIMLLKARQNGASWIMGAYDDWVARFHNVARLPMLSQGEREAKELLSKARFILDNLPSFMGVIYDKASTEQLNLKATQSVIEALPSTPGAGRSLTGTVVVCDEQDFHQYAEENYAAIKPTIDAGGQMIGASTIDKKKQISLFKALCLEARSGESSFSFVFMGVFARPGLVGEWY